MWINEDAPPEDATQDSWDACLKAVRDCDVLIVLSNGNAGWAKRAGEIGICHAEYMEGLASSRGKVRLIALPNVPVDTAQADITQRNQLFQDYVALQSPLEAGMSLRPRSYVRACMRRCWTRLLS